MTTHIPSVGERQRVSADLPHDLTHDLRRAHRRHVALQRTLTFLSVACIVFVASIGIGSLLALADPPRAVGLVILTLWFIWALRLAVRRI